jgi:hypothetical protein
MSESDSISSTRNNVSSDKNPAEPAPYLKKKPDNSDENTYSYFIPAVMLIVLGVIVVATFYSKEFNGLVASVIPAFQQEQFSADAKDRNVSIRESETTGTTGITASAENAVTAADSAEFATASNATGSVQVPETTSPASQRNLVSMQNRPAYPAHMNYASPYTRPPAPHAMQGEWNAYNEMMEQRRRAYDEAMQARQQHLKRMHEYQAAVMNRITQDREEMYRHMQQLAQESQKKRDQFMRRIEPAAKQASDRPI